MTSMTTITTMPLIDVGDDAFERGLVHGREMAPRIRENLETYMRRFEAGGRRRAGIERLGAEWAEFIAADNVAYADEMRGIAEGAALAFRDVAVLNARWEIAYSVFAGEAAASAGAAALPDGCTAFGLMGEATAHGGALMGQNWDWLTGVRGHTFMLRARRTDLPDFIGFTEAGIVGCKIGVNEAGIGLCMNGLVSSDDGGTALAKPIHVRCREIFDAWTFDKAIMAVIQTDRVCSANFLIGHADGEFIDIEATPAEASYLYPDADGIVTHANHLVVRGRATSEFERLGPSTLFRSQRLARLLRRHRGGIESAHIEDALRDHFSNPSSICRHADESLAEARRTITVTSAIIDLGARVVRATDGPPCENAYHTYALGAPTDAAAGERAADALPA